MSFGRTIAEARKRANLSQRKLAARVIKEDGRPISPKYLNASSVAGAPPLRTV